jgi:hypothetical protein
MVLRFWKSMLVMVTFYEFFFAFMKGIDNGGPIPCELF